MRTQKTASLTFKIGGVTIVTKPGEVIEEIPTPETETFLFEQFGRRVAEIMRQPCVGGADMLQEISDAAEARGILLNEWTCNVSCDHECHETGTVGCPQCSGTPTKEP